MKYSKEDQLSMIRAAEKNGFYPLFGTYNYDSKKDMFRADIENEGARRALDIVIDVLGMDLYSGDPDGLLADLQLAQENNKSKDAAKRIREALKKS